MTVWRKCMNHHPHFTHNNLLLLCSISRRSNFYLLFEIVQIPIGLALRAHCAFCATLPNQFNGNAFPIIGAAWRLNVTMSNNIADVRVCFFSPESCHAFHRALHQGRVSADPSNSHCNKIILSWRNLFFHYFDIYYSFLQTP